MTGFAGGILNAYGRFGVPAFTPVLLNSALLAPPSGSRPRLRSRSMPGAGCVYRGLLQLLFQLPPVQSGTGPKTALGYLPPQVRRIMTLMVPVSLAFR